MKAFLFSIISTILIANISFASTRVVELQSDKNVYSVGETAVLRANFYIKPDNSDFEFDIIANLNGTPIAVDRVTDFQMFSAAKNLVAGNYLWNVRVVLQDARYARDLKETIKYYTSSISDLDAKIAIETDPVKLANLQKNRTDAITLKDAAISELNQIRTPVLSPLFIPFTVQ